jgi:hypothetical protein
LSARYWPLYNGLCGPGIVKRPPWKKAKTGFWEL